MQITVRYFAGARDLAGCTEEHLQLEGDTVTQEQLRARLCEVHPRLSGYLDRMRFALNGDFAEDSVAVTDGDELDILPPVAGGSPVLLCEITEESIRPEQVRALVEHASAGGIAVFIGTVRDHADGKQVARLDYEAHHALALQEMQRVLTSVADKYTGARIAAVHRVGSLKVGDVAVVVAASAAHREEAFAACRAAIEGIKASVPIWKKEWDREGQATWVNLDPS